MSLTTFNSERFQYPDDIAPASAVSISDTPPAEKAAPVAQRGNVWPIVMISIGGLATLAWNGFLIWHTARAVLGWLAGEA
jgi:hypothetical protein